MSARPLLLDLFCGAGGAAVGYHRAGFDVVGVDIEPQPNYPFAYYRHDAIAFLRQAVKPPEPLNPWYSWGDLAAIHASPPCQHHTTLAKGNNANQGDYPDLVDTTRQLLIETGLPYVIENVPSAPLRNPIKLCGEMFGLDVIRHRLFESNMPLMQPPHPRHRGRVAGYRHGTRFDGPYFAVYGTGGAKGSLAEWQQAMGMPWAQTKAEIREAVPPSYCEFVGTQLLDAIGVAA